MGHTHYWHRPQTLSKEKFMAFARDCYRLCRNLSVPLGHAEGQGEAAFSDDEIIFNGHVASGGFARCGGLNFPADDAVGIGRAGEDVARVTVGNTHEVTKRCVDENDNGSYEAFILERNLLDEEILSRPDQQGLYHEFCKTNFRPYDLDVQCCLIAFKQHFGRDVRVLSDGPSQLWQEAREACQQILGYGETFTLDSWEAF